MPKVDIARSYKPVHIQTENTEAKKPNEGYKKIFEKLISVKNNVVAYLSHVKTHSLKSVKHLIGSLKSVRADKRRGSGVAQQGDDNIDLVSYKPLRDPLEQFENDVAEQLRELNESFQKEVADEKYREQVIDAIFAAIYRDVKASFEIHYFFNKPDMPGDENLSLPGEYLKTIGQTAYDWDVSCNEKSGVYVPKGAGANPLLNSVISILQKKYSNQIKDQKNIEKINDNINAMVDRYCIDNGLKSPLAFKSVLIGITENWQGNINKDNSSDA